MDLGPPCRREDEQEAGRLLAELEHSLPQVFTHLASFTEPEEGISPPCRAPPSLPWDHGVECQPQPEAVVAVGEGRCTQLGPNEAVLQLGYLGGPGAAMASIRPLAIRSSSQRC